MTAIKEQKYTLRDRAKFLLQSALHKAGYHLRRLEPGVDINDAHVEASRLASDNARVIFEVGAANGRDTARFAREFPNAKVYAFEPVPGLFNLLQNSVAEYSNVTTVNAAMCDKVGSANFHLSNWIDASSLLKPKSTNSTFDQYVASNKSITVATQTLDEYCADNAIEHIDLLKMDTQGAELTILNGAEKLLVQGAIRVIYTEAHFMEMFENCARLDQITSYLLSKGFRLHNLFNITHNQRGEIAWCDAIFVKAQA